MDNNSLNKTEHNKIFVEKPKDADMSFVEESIAEFKKVDSMTREEIVSLLRRKVPTFKTPDEVNSEVAVSKM